jgi:hypothetical protein
VRLFHTPALARRNAAGAEFLFVCFDGRQPQSLFVDYPMRSGAAAAAWAAEVFAQVAALVSAQEGSKYTLLRPAEQLFGIDAPAPCYSLWTPIDGFRSNYLSNEPCVLEVWPNAGLSGAALGDAPDALMVEFRSIVFKFTVPDDRLAEICGQPASRAKQTGLLAGILAIGLGFGESLRWNCY